MNSKIKYSVMYYTPSLVSNERMNIGILFQNMTDKSILLKTIKNKSRLASFDDELNVDLFMDMLQSIKSQTEVNLLNTLEFDFDNFTKRFVSQFLFDKSVEIETDDFESSIDNLSKIYMRYDFKKEERLHRDTEIKIIKTIMKSKNIHYSTALTEGLYNERIKFDFKLDDNELYKFIDLSNIKENKIHFIKGWAFNCMEFSKMNKNIKINFIINNEDLEDNSLVVSAKEILNDSGCNILTEMEFMQELDSKKSNFN